MNKYLMLLIIIVFLGPIINCSNDKDISITYYSDYLAEAEQLEVKFNGEFIFYKYEYYSKEEESFIGQMPNKLYKDIIEKIQSVKYDQLKTEYDGKLMLDDVYDVFIVDINKKSYKFTGLGFEDEPKELRTIIDLLKKYSDLLEPSENSVLQSFTHNLIKEHTKRFDSFNAKNESKNSEYFIVVEEMPEIIGGYAAIQSKIVYPKTAKEIGVQGKVFVRAYINVNGIVDKTELVRGIGEGCDEEAMRVIEMTPFKPGKQRGKAVKVKITIPVVFKN